MLEAFNSIKPDLEVGIKDSKRNPIEIGQQIATFVEPGGFIFADPELSIQPFDGFLESQIETIEVGHKYDALPDVLSYDLYGTHDLWWMLLRLNGAAIRAEFRGPTIKIYNKVSSAGSFLDAMKLGKVRAEATTQVVTHDLTLRKVYE